MLFSKNTEKLEEVQVEENTPAQDVSLETFSRTQKWVKPSTSYKEKSYASSWGLVKPSASAWSLVKPSPYTWSSVKPTTGDEWSSVKPTTVNGWSLVKPTTVNGWSLVNLKTVSVSRGSDNVKENQVVRRKRSFDSCTGSTSADNHNSKKAHFTSEDRRLAIETMKVNPNSCDADHYMLGATESGVQFEKKNKERVVVQTTMRTKDFRS